MFYQDKTDEALRFGDVLKGYVLATSNIEEPIFGKDYKIGINLPVLCVVISPCCSIGEKMISLSPLIALRGKFFDNPYFAEDLTRINRKMEPQQAVPPDVWDNFLPDEKQKRLKEGNTYAFVELFIYEKNDLFSKYPINRKQGNIETNYFMIDFRNTHKISCEKIVTPKDAPLESKVLQLSIKTRSELREKIAEYYARIPKEDKILED